jgi:hypothetical protein
MSDGLSADQRLILRGRRVMRFSIALYALTTVALMASAIVVGSPELPTFMAVGLTLLGLDVVGEILWAAWLLLGDSPSEPAAQVRQSEAIRVLFTVIAVLVTLLILGLGYWPSMTNRGATFPWWLVIAPLATVAVLLVRDVAVRRYPALPQDLPWHARRLTVPTRAGWYQDPEGGAPLRWWDGARWTDQVYDPAEPTP